MFRDSRLELCKYRCCASLDWRFIYILQKFQIELDFLKRTSNSLISFHRDDSIFEVVKLPEVNLKNCFCSMHVSHAFLSRIPFPHNNVRGLFNGFLMTFEIAFLSRRGKCHQGDSNSYITKRFLPHLDACNARLMNRKCAFSKQKSAGKEWGKLNFPFAMKCMNSRRVQLVPCFAYPNQISDSQRVNCISCTFSEIKRHDMEFK